MSTDVKKDFRRHLTALGYELDASRKIIGEKLAAQMGDARSREFKATTNRAPSASGQEALYHHFKNLAEANLFRSFDAAPVVEANTRLYEQARTHF